MRFIKALYYLFPLFLLGFSVNTVADTKAQLDSEIIYISTCEQLQGIGTTTGPLNGIYYQISNIDCSEIENFIPIGNSFSTPFTGHYNGQGYTISHLYI